jgi:hypothetical protein
MSISEIEKEIFVHAGLKDIGKWAESSKSMIIEWIPKFLRGAKYRRK